jgi:hypothetical protein
MGDEAKRNVFEAAIPLVDDHVHEIIHGEVFVELRDIDFLNRATRWMKIAGPCETCREHISVKFPLPEEPQ